MAKEKPQAIRNITWILPGRGAVAVLFTPADADTLGQGSEHHLPGLCGGRVCGHDVVPAVAVAPLLLARHVDTSAVS